MILHIFLSSNLLGIILSYDLMICSVLSSNHTRCCCSCRCISHCHYCCWFCSCTCCSCCCSSNTKRLDSLETITVGLDGTLKYLLLRSILHLVCKLVELTEFRVGTAASAPSVQEGDEGYGSVDEQDGEKTN